MNITCHRDLSVNIVILPRGMLGTWPSYFQVGGALVMALQRSLVWAHSHQVWTRSVSVVRGGGWPRPRVTRALRGQHHPPGYRGYPPSRALTCVMALTSLVTSRVSSPVRGREARSGEDAARHECDSLHIRPGLLIRVAHQRRRIPGGCNYGGVIN